jgi:hypothetical protein
MLLGSLAFVLLAFVTAGWAETLRVATWSFPPASDAFFETEAQVKEAAAALKQLNPDVILLQSVGDWQTCSALAEALEPAQYTVLVCSAFRSATNTSAAPQQVAILSKHKGYFSWAEPWRGEDKTAVPGGFAFAAIQVAKHRVGFYAVDPHVLGTNRSAATYAALSRQWAQAVTTFKSWVTNRVEAVVVADGDLGADATVAALTTGFLNAPLHGPVTLSVRSAPTNAPGSFLPAGLTADAKTVPALVLMGPQVACAVNLDAPKAVVAQAAAAKTPAGRTNSRPPVVVSNPEPAAVASSPRPAATTPSVPPSAAAPHRQQAYAKASPYLLGGGAFAVLAAVGWFWSRRRRARAARSTAVLPTNGVASYTLVVSPQSIDGSATSTAVPSSLLQPVPWGEAAGSAPRPVEVWPPGPVLLAPELQHAAAQERAGLRSQLAQWLKQKLVQKLLSDRAELLKTQQVATGKLLSFEERLAKLERQFQQQNQAYEERILELNRELADAKEENRELIRARIAQVKAEMEAARARLLAQAGVGER